MPRKKVYEVELSQAERDHLKNLVSTGTQKARKLTRARILLKADEGRIPDKATLIKVTTAWDADRNQRAASVNWQFTTHDARIKLHRLYPSF